MAAKVDVKATLIKGLAMYEASVKRMITSKPQYEAIFREELAAIDAARKSLG